MIYAAFGIIALFLIYCRKSEKPPKTAAAGFITGGAALIAAHFIGKNYGIDIPVNIFTSAMSMCGGLPAVALIIINELYM